MSIRWKLPGAFLLTKAHPEARNDEPLYDSIEETQKAIEDRLRVDGERYQTLYGVNYLDRNNYDLVIDTTHTPAAAVAELILQKIG